MDKTLAEGIWCPDCKIYEPGEIEDGRCKGCFCPAGVHVKAKVVRAEADKRATPEHGIGIRCIAHSHETHTFPTWTEVEAWADQHAATVAHDGRWAITFVLGYQGREPSGRDGVTYREPMLTEGKAE